MKREREKVWEYGFLKINPMAEIDGRLNFLAFEWAKSENSWRWENVYCVCIAYSINTIRQIEN